MSDLNSFREFFPGLYFTTSFGNSTIINVNYTTFYVHYHYTDVKGSSTGQDTIRTDAMKLYITPDVTQITLFAATTNSCWKKGQSHLCEKSGRCSNRDYLPFSEINQELESRALNLANLPTMQFLRQLKILL